jgi:antitoxin component YwqK of YwqJK toxin-antitoxin module
MMDKENYANGRKRYDIMGDTITYYYPSGEVKSRGDIVDDLKEGEWSFYREDGQLYEVGNFLKGEKHGRWIRYDELGEIQHEEEFKNGRVRHRDSPE